MDKLDLAPATLEALKTLSAISSNQGVEELTNSDKLTASLERIKAKKNMKLFEKLDKVRQEFSTLNHKITQMEESILDLREVTSNLVKSLPSAIVLSQPTKPTTDSRVQQTTKAVAQQQQQKGEKSTP